MPTASAFIAKLAAQIGYREGWNGSYYNNDTKFGVWYGLNYQPWCAIFMSWGANEVGALGTLVPKYASCTAGLKWFRDRGQTGVWPPRQGDIFILREYAPSRWNADSDGWAPIHTGAVERWEGDLNSGYIVTIEGNTNTGGSSQGNGVYRLRRFDSKDGRHLIYCRPKWDPEPAAPSRTETRTDLFNYSDVSMDMSKTIDAESLRPKATNAHVARLESAIWNWRGIGFRKTLVSKYKLTRRAQLYNQNYDAMLVWMVGDTYKLLDSIEPNEGWLTKDQREGRAALPTWPGPKFLRRIGFKSIG